MNILKITIFILLFSLLSHADETDDYIDSWHKSTSQRFKRASEYLDDKLVDVAKYVGDDDNKTIKVLKSKKKLGNRKRYADKFFLSNKYLSETDDPFMRVTPETTINSRSIFDNKTKLKISAHIPLNRSKKQFQLFIGNLSNNNFNNFTSKNTTQSKPELGINYFLPEYYHINSKYSLGIKGLVPFARARYSTVYNNGKWDTEFVQTFEYFVDDKFREKTQGFFDTTFYNLSLFRLFIERSTQSKSAGMSYNAGFVMFWQPSYKAGLTLTQAFFGDTNYQYYKNNNISPYILEDTSGINNYLTKLTYRKSFYRKWLFYEIEPGVNYSVVNDYKANYSLRLSIDVFYGDI